MHRRGRSQPLIPMVGMTGQVSETARQAGEDTSLMQVQQGQTVARNACFLVSVIVPRVSSTRDMMVLETAMQGLALDANRPVALELAATTTSRHFLLRATSALSLRHLA